MTENGERWILYAYKLDNYINVTTTIYIYISIIVFVYSHKIWFYI